MSLLIPNASEATLLKYALGAVTPNNQELRLFTNDVTPLATHTAASYTQLTGHGYTAKVLTKTSWDVAAGDEAIGTYAEQTWIFTADTAVTVYGYYIIDSVSGLLLWAERFTTGKVLQYAGDQIRLTPTITLSTLEV